MTDRESGKSEEAEAKQGSEGMERKKPEEAELIYIMKTSKMPVNLEIRR